MILIVITANVVPADSVLAKPAEYHFESSARIVMIEHTSDQGFRYKIYDIDRDIGTAYGVNSFPYWVFLDKDLKVVARRTGNLPQDQVGQLLIALANQ